MMVVWKSTKLKNYPFVHQVVTLGNSIEYLTLLMFSTLVCFQGSLPSHFENQIAIVLR
jgi:hypothetical protein